MTLATLADLKELLATARARLLGCAADAPEAARNWQPAADKWSITGHLEHISLFERLCLPLLEGLAARGRAEGLSAEPGAARQLDVMALLQQAGAGDRRFASPPAARPRGLSYQAALAELQQSRAFLDALIPDFDSLDTDRLHHRHAVLGIDLNAGQWLHFIAVHDRLHAGHIRRLHQAWQETQATDS